MARRLNLNPDEYRVSDARHILSCNGTKKQRLAIYYIVIEEATGEEVRIVAE